MASSSPISQQQQQEDLINLEEVDEQQRQGASADDDCVARTRSVSSNVPGDGSPEELEHLLDVCPPQLEEKLSLTRKDESIDRGKDERATEQAGEDILVSLGHDKLVPRRKRIDVVSSETIKRIRDITKNLEPVIRNCSDNLRSNNDYPVIVDDVVRDVDENDWYGCYAEDPVAEIPEAKCQNPSASESMNETEEAINTAFDFLSELDDDLIEDDDYCQSPKTKRRKNTHHENHLVSSSSPPYPLEPTCLVKIQSNDCSSFSSSASYHHCDIEPTDSRYAEDNEKNCLINRQTGRTSLLPRNHQFHENDENHENLGFDASPTSINKQSNFHRHNSTDSLDQTLSKSPADEKRGTRAQDEIIVASNSSSHPLNPQILNWKDDVEDNNRKDLNHFEKSISIDIDGTSEASNTNEYLAAAALLQPSSAKSFRQQANGVDKMGEVMVVGEDSPASCSSECSEVDWSWVAEYETRPNQNSVNLLENGCRTTTATRCEAKISDENSVERSDTFRRSSRKWCRNGNEASARNSVGGEEEKSSPVLSDLKMDKLAEVGGSGVTARLQDDENVATGKDRGQGTKQEARVAAAVGAAAGDTNECESSVAMSVVDVVGAVGTGKRQLSCPVTTETLATGDPPPPCSSDAARATISTSNHFTEIGVFPNNECQATCADDYHPETDETILVSSENSRHRRCRVRGGDFSWSAIENTIQRSSNRNGNDNDDDRSTSSPRLSWLRASMRRLRHLRLPDTAANDRNSETRNTAPETMLRNESLLSSPCGPNSLPDISLIAPEVLAAHTNSMIASTGATDPAAPGRPSSAPVYNQQTTAIPRRGRRRATNSRGRPVTNHHSSIRSPAYPSSTNHPSAPPPPPPPPRDNNNIHIGLQTISVPRVPCTTSQEPEIHRSAANQHAASTNTSNNNPARRICERPRESERVSGSGSGGSGSGSGEDEDEDENPLGRWPHPLSPAFACLGCTLGLFNISRFATLSIQFGANFIVQFLVLSLVLGIPLLTLQVCLGQRLGAGAVDMWRISPIFHGVGIALLVAQALIGIYSIIGVSWMFVYFRDSFITKQDRYRWEQPFSLYHDDTRMLDNSSGNYKLEETVPDYFNGVVLQRNHYNEPDPATVTLKFQVAFNLAVVWMIVFVSLSKGLRSYGKVVYVLTLVPVVGTLVLCTKLLGLTPPGSINQLFPATVWSEFFINSKSWVAASSEVFLTWGLFGAAAMQVAAHNKHKHLLQRDTSLVVVLTIVVLLLSAFLANTCVQILQHYGYHYITSSFERISEYAFMRKTNQPAGASGFSNTPERFMSHASFIVGQRVIKPGSDLSAESGYQALRLSTELVPATLAILGTERVSPFWAVLFYFVLILFGIAQQLAIWHCVITGIMAINRNIIKVWKTTITFFSCACAYILGLPMATELGIYIVYYLDYVVGGAWWIMILYLVQVGAVFAVRGRPHTGETVVAELFPPTGRCMRHWAGPLLSFTWNVILPVALMVLSITIFKSSSFRELYVYRRTSRDYWSVWARQLGAAIQLTPILIIPGVAIIQTCRYLNSGPPDIFDRIQLLYRPPMDANGSTTLPINYGNEQTSTTSIHGNGILRSSNEPPPSPATTAPFQDPPPKYTPPPSYTTATGARIAKMLRQSIRRSVRRIASVLGETSTPRTRPALQQPPPPDYATVLVEMNQSTLSEQQLQDTATTTTTTIIRELVPPDLTDTRLSIERQRQHHHERHRPRTIDRTTRISTIEPTIVERTHSTMDRGRRNRIYNSSGGSNLTAADVANLLRSSIRRGGAITRTQTTNQDSCGNCCNNDLGPIASIGDGTMTAASVDNLVNAAVPINEDNHPPLSLYDDKNVPLVHDKSDDNDDEDDRENKTVNETERSVSVI